MCYGIPCQVLLIFQFSRKNLQAYKIMDWVFKASSSWDMTELDFGVLDDTNKNQYMEVFSVDPSSGKSFNKWNEQKHSTMSGSSKKQHISCLVDGCTADLTSCRDYHRRHRVCETHSKTPVVTIGGKDQRFCQQCSRRNECCFCNCLVAYLTLTPQKETVAMQIWSLLKQNSSRIKEDLLRYQNLFHHRLYTNTISDQLSEFDRFHSVGEFDEVKRSCRKRLDGHNRRRRKPKPESMYLNYGSFSTNHQGTKLVLFGGSPEYTSIPLRWPYNEKLKQQVHVSVQQRTPSHPYTRFCIAREKKFPFLLGTEASSQIPERLVEPKGALSLLSKHTIHTSKASPSDPLNHHPLLPLGNVRGGDTDNHSEGLLEDESYTWPSQIEVDNLYI
ncbi:Transcription factor, SBP-box [Cynara cardunculus var. scolymus]|uniref:Transcription factor, SBP-box n=1 Tax=Cynara cardunculus var. scolymus TaxID=59895 RepID=A0A118JUP6_CYNCS|nr:Transcription factor, SBP-box [Cynara cardunculus var. scolymus]